MPAVRDYRFEYESVTSDAGLILNMPSVQQNDLILVFAGSDAGSTITYTPPSGYNTLYTRNPATNSPGYTVLWKIAGASEPSSITVGANVNESYHGAILTIEDVDTTNPFGSPSVYSERFENLVQYKSTMPQITTNRNNSLIVYLTNSGTSIPEGYNGPASTLIADVGHDESYCLGFGFQATAGQTPAVTIPHTSSYRNIATIQIAPPTTGASVIPIYVKEDDSYLLNPLNASSTYGTMSVPVLTADTNFGSSIGGFTVVDASTSTVLNQWLIENSTRAFTTNSTTANVVSAAESTFSPAIDLSNKNILIHWQPNTLATLRSIGKSSENKGIWLGLRSGTATNYKIWQVYAQDIPQGYNRFLPSVICPESTALFTSGTLNTTAITGFGFFIYSSITSAANYFNRLWVLGKTVLCGGSTSNPITISKISIYDSTYKIKVSSYIQGENQLQLYSVMQIGNGSEKTILNLSNTSIEFPSQRDTSKSLINYNSIDNNCGFLYHASANDTIKHISSSVYSPSRYKWGFVDGSSTSATYDFKGTSVIGAGTITLNLAITMEGLTINNYTTVSATGMTFLSCSISNVPATNNSFTGFSAFNISTIDVSTVGASNYWVSIANPSVFTNCTFKGGTGHAIRITTPGTYTLTGNQFSSFGADGSTGAAIFNDSGGAVTLNIVNGSTPTIKNGTGATTTVNNAINLTLTGIVAGSDIVILNAGTTTERVNVDQNPTSSYVYSYTTALEYVDIGVFKKGYVPFYIRNYQLGSTSGTLPVNQATDRNYTD